MKKIVSKKPHHSGFEGWDIITDDGVEWSVVNFGGKRWRETYKNTPHKYYLATYRGWEAYDGENVLRATTKKEVIEKLLSNTHKNG